MIDDIDANFVPTFFYSLKTFFNNQSQGENKDYLLISIDKANIYWMIKIPNNILSNDFLTLLNYILPFNINIKYIKFDNLTETINEQFIIISTNICPLLITNRSNFLINESFSNSLGVYYSDFNILIESLEYLTEEERSSYQLSYLKQAELAVIYEIHL